MKLAAAAGKEHIAEKKVEEAQDFSTHHEIPGLDADHPDYAHHCELVANIKKNNPALYKKMLAWG